LKEINMPPNNLQLSIAQAAFGLIDKYQRQLYVLPCGSGKSRVAATLALLLLGLKPKVKNVHIVYSNDILLRKDEEDFQDLWKLLPNGERVSYHSDTSFLPGSSSVVIMDESDEAVFNDPKAFQKFARKTSCVCLTATCAETYIGGIERNVLKKMDFRIFEDLIEHAGKKVTAPSFKKLKRMTDEETIALLEEKTQQQAVLLYCGTELKDILISRLEYTTYIDEAVSHTKLRNLDESIDGRFSLLVTDQASQGLRGLDLRSYSNAITLITLRSF